MKELLAGTRLSRVLMAMVALLLPTRAWAVQATLTADAHVSSAQRAVNAGGLSNLNAGGGYTSLVQFELGVLPAGTTAVQIARATLRVYCNRADTPGQVSLQPVYSAWTEFGVTYATMPVLGTSAGSAQVLAAGTFVTFDVTALVQGWVSAPGSNDGLALSSSAAVVQFDSKENDQTSHAPQLEIALVASSGGGSPGATGALGATGATGLAGAIGATGATGAAGVVGPTGLIGATGATGATGAAGPAGAGLVNYLGTYSSTANYANGDVVQFAGSAYISHGASNQGNTPGVSSAWGLLASVGSTGAAGPVGGTGATGQQGPAGFGIQGVTGSTGAAGVTGATGTAGLVYQGQYSSTTNYTLGDVVVWDGASYASLVGFNHGNTPGMVPGTWGLLTSQGPMGLPGATGAAGVTGATGVLGPVGPPGEKGDQGGQGVAGQAGAQGIPGITGATGQQGPMGSTGPGGPVGMSFQGAYSAFTNYNVGQGVFWQGAGWVSLGNGNHGNTPDASPSWWSMFAAPGAGGATGATGIGLAGATGATGLAGVNGTDGRTGATGATGPAGLVYQGAYSSSANYALGDVAVWNGASYVSLLTANRGNTPGMVPGTWGVLTSQGGAGPAGAVGPVGVTGATGVVGPMGSPGPQGPQGAAGMAGSAGAQGLVGATGAAGSQGAAGPVGVAGSAGAQGIPGAAGATGSQGPMGPVGAAGPVGLSFQGNYNAAVNYGLGDGVLWQGAGWVSLLSGNRGNTPDGSPSAWAMFAAPGATGVTGAMGVGVAGAMGATGAVGATGAAGTTGTTGATGAPGLHFVGAYSSSSGYSLGDGVSYNGASYASLTNNNHGQAPDQFPGAWGLLAAQGAAGQAGNAGVAGATGAAGSAGAPGVTGATGLTGAAGAQGAVGLAFHGGWTQTTRYALNDAVSFAGSTYIALSATINQEPDQAPEVWSVLAEAGGVGPTGTAGAIGAAATVAVGSVTTLPAGSQATVTNAGTNAAAVLNFGIPQGAAGSSGGTSASAPRVPAMYHSVNYSTSFYALNSTSSATTDTPAVLAWMPQGCTASRLDVFSQQSNAITVTLRIGTATALADTALACTAAIRGSCTTTGAIAVAAGEFMDLHVVNASGTLAPVWVALECDP